MAPTIAIMALLAVLASPAIAGGNIEAYFSIKCAARSVFNWSATLLEKDVLSDDIIGHIWGQSTNSEVNKAQIDAFDLIDNYLTGVVYQSFEFVLRIVHDCSPDGSEVVIDDKSYDSCVMHFPTKYTCKLDHTTYFIDKKGDWMKKKDATY